ncbi:MAG TPA: tetratricopeptide repeat protein, partial [Tepidisphaeraceae bacterium]
MLGILTISAHARGGAYDDQTIPGKWIKPLLPEEGDQPDYPAYDKDAIDKARDQYWAGQYRRALVTLEPVAKPRKPLEVELLRAECDLELGRYAEATAALGKPGVAGEPAAEVLLARVLAAQGGYATAIGVLQREIQKSPDRVAAHFYLGEYYEKAGNVPAATAAYQWFVTDPHDYLQQWVGHPETFDDAEEVTLIGRAIDRWATLTTAYQHELRLHDVILNMFVRAYDQIDRGYWPAHFAAAESFFQHDDPPSAMDELEQALKANPYDMRSWALVGRMRLAEFNFDKVDQAVSAIREVDQDSVAADLLEARNLLLQRVPKQAVPSLTRVLSRQPHNIEALGLMAGAEALMLHDDQCAELLKQAD